MKDATFKKRAKSKDNSETFSATIQAKTAETPVRPRREVVHVRLDQAEIQNYSRGRQRHADRRTRSWRSHTQSKAISSCRRPSRNIPTTRSTGACQVQES